ncbi:MAG: ExeA family protein [Thiobacillaceae bacterium]
MYNAFFGLTKNPFNMTPDPAFLYHTDQHREALAGLTYAILNQKGFLALSGMAGAGKTTLLAWVLQKLPVTKVQSSVILNPTLTPNEFLEMAMLDFGITDIPTSKAHRLWTLQKFLLKGQREDKVSVLIIDEAHKLSPEVLEEIRFLGNFESADAKLLQVVLIGQNELDQLLGRPELWQFKQRISVRLSLKPLGTPEVGDYIRHRWTVAGGEQTPFSSDAVGNIAKWSKGIPRLINSICDNALVQAFAECSHTVNADHVRMAAGDLLLIEKSVQLLTVPLPAPIAPPPAPRVVPPTKFNTLDKYAPKPPRQSVFARWAGRLRSV